MNGKADSAKVMRDLACASGLDNPWTRLPIIGITAPGRLAPAADRMRAFARPDGARRAGIIGG
jgi:hypothetical protein